MARTNSVRCCCRVFPERPVSRFPPFRVSHFHSLYSSPRHAISEFITKVFVPSALSTGLLYCFWHPFEFDAELLLHNNGIDGTTLVVLL